MRLRESDEASSDEASYTLFEHASPQHERLWLVGCAAILCFMIGTGFHWAQFSLLNVASDQTIKLALTQTTTSTGKNATPVLLMHGLGDSSDGAGFAALCDSVRRWTGGHVVCAPIANGWDSVMLPMHRQVAQLAQLVAADPLLANGFDAIGFSQGALVVRGYLQQHNRPRVRRYISLVGPQSGVGQCPLVSYRWLCQLWLAMPYSAPVSFAGYWKDASDRDAYLSQSTWLADLNNERSVNETYRKHLQQLELCVLVRALEDTMVVPSVSEHFGYWAWGNPGGPELPLQQTEAYATDALGLRTLDESGRLKLLTYPGDHMRFSEDFWSGAILPLLSQSPQ